MYNLKKVESKKVEDEYFNLWDIEDGFTNLEGLIWDWFASKLIQCRNKTLEEVEKKLKRRIEDLEKLHDSVSAEYVRLFLDQVLDQINKLKTKQL